MRIAVHRFLARNRASLRDICQLCRMNLMCLLLVDYVLYTIETQHLNRTIPLNLIIFRWGSTSISVGYDSFQEFILEK